MNKIIISAIIMSISMNLIGCNNSAKLGNENQTTKGTAKISIEEAKNIALDHANLTSDKVSFVRIERDFDHGVEKYDIEFDYGNTEYEYEINAATGEIIEYNREVR